MSYLYKQNKIEMYILKVAVQVSGMSEFLKFYHPILISIFRNLLYREIDLPYVVTTVITNSQYFTNHDIN